MAALGGQDSGIISPGFNSIIQSARREAIGLQIGVGPSGPNKETKNKSLADKKQSLGLSPTIGRSREVLLFGGKRSSLK